MDWRARRVPSRLSAIVCAVLTLALLTACAATSKGGTATTIQNLALHRGYTVTNPVNDPLFVATEQSGSWGDKGGELTDGQVGTVPPVPGQWVGFSHQLMRTITINLGNEDTVAQIIAHFAQSQQGGITVPPEVTFLASTDGKAWHSLGASPSPVSPTNTQAQVVPIELSGLNVTARYIRLEFPVAVWAFLSDIQVMGYPGVVHAARPSQTAAPAPAADRGYLTPAQSGGVGHMLLTYLGPLPSTGSYAWQLTPQQWLPLISYTNPSGKPQGWFFDTILTLMNGQGMSNTQASWQWWLDNLFALAPSGKSGTQLPALNTAAGMAAQALNDPSHQVNVVITIPYPNPSGTDWASGVSFADPSQRISAVQWFIAQALKDWQQADFTHLHLAGFYWDAESFGMVPGETQLLQQTSATIHSDGLRFYWIPFFGATYATAWKALGFDAAYLQPNYEFHASATPQRLAESAAIARHYGMGLEMELGALTYSDGSVPRYFTYFNAGLAYNYAQNASIAFYDGTQLLLQAASGPERSVYDQTHAFVAGTYQTQYVGPGVTLPSFQPLLVPPGIVNTLPAQAQG